MAMIAPASQASGISKCHITQPPNAASARVRENVATELTHPDYAS
nr:hypothetical protein SFHH103_04422 [Sinorhizobium fredii HH103]